MYTENFTKSEIQIIANITKHMNDIEQNRLSFHQFISKILLNKISRQLASNKISHQ